jgi:hypothetical protein
LHSLPPNLQSFIISSLHTIINIISQASSQQAFSYSNSFIYNHSSFTSPLTQVTSTQSLQTHLPFHLLVQSSLQHKSSLSRPIHSFLRCCYSFLGHQPPSNQSHLF